MSDARKLESSFFDVRVVADFPVDPCTARERTLASPAFLLRQSCRASRPRSRLDGASTLVGAASKTELTTAPDGVTKYYYNSETKQSTYKRPMIAPPTIPAAAAPAPAPEGKKKKEKKERAKTKVPIPGTAWLRVTTNTGGVFYFESEARRSEWTVPEEIAEAVAAFDAAEKAEKQAKAEEERLERLREQERVRAEVKAEHQRKAEERKRKAGEGKEDKEVPKKKAKKSEGEEKKAKEGWAEDDGAPAEDEDAYAGGQGEAWRQAIAAEFAEVDATKAAEEADAEEREKKAEQEAAKKVFAAENVNVSPEEARALFKVS